jgi:hypothetical protein
MVAIAKVLPGLPVTDSNLGSNRMRLNRIGRAAKDLGLRINNAGQLLFPIYIPGVATRYEVFTPEILAKVAECSES